MPDMKEKVALITGASSGIGRATAAARAGMGPSSRHQSEGHISVLEVRGSGDACGGPGWVNCQRRFRELLSRLFAWRCLCRVEAWADRPDDMCVRGTRVTGDQGQPRVSGIHRYADASAGSGALRRRALRRYLGATGSHETRWAPRGNRSGDCLSVLRRRELHHGHDVDTGWRLHSDGLT